ncbi:MAG: FAD-dependent oxidoreductase [Calditrichia bacterium]
MAKFDYDLIVIGGGSAGISSAILGMKLGKKVALVEKNRIGGDCTWYGCVPSKALIKVSEVAHKTTHLYDYGLRLNAPVKPDTSQVMNHVRSIREQVYQEETPEVFEKMGIAVFIGPPEFLDAYRLKIGDKSISVPI